MTRTAARRGLAAASCALAAASLCGCGTWRPARVPMDAVLDRSTCAPNADTLLVMLPGAYSHPDEFVREGFVEAVAERRLAVDVLRVDAHLGYYTGKTILERLQDDVVAPARARGYRSVWIVGISAGSFGGLAYSATRPSELAGIVALAPYLGERLTSTEIDNAGGLMRWRPAIDPLARDADEQRLWRWLQRYGSDARSPELPALYLGYGRDDRFAFSHRLLAPVLPPERVFTTEGGHDWPEWRRLWRAVLPTLPLPACRT